jgi:hypothetical protein
MENHKFEVANYKTKERVKVPKDRHIVVENTHESIVSHEDFEKVQELVKMRHRPKKHEIDNVFKSLVFCADCGSRMTFEIKSRKHLKREILICRYHFRNPEKCKFYNYIYYRDLYDTVLERIQKVAKSIESGELIRRVRNQANKQNKKDKLERRKQKSATYRLYARQNHKEAVRGLCLHLLDATLSQNAERLPEGAKTATERSGVIQSELDKKDEYPKICKLSEAIQMYLNVKNSQQNMLNQLIESIGN